MNGKVIYRVLICASVICYIAACFLPVHRNDEPAQGALMLLFGGLAFIADIPTFLVWCANPLMFLSTGLMCSKIGSPNIPIILSFLAFILGVGFMFMDTIVDNEAGASVDRGPLKIGYYTWLLSLALMFISSLVAKHTDRTDKHIRGCV